MEKILLRSAGSDQKAFTTGLRSLSLRLFCGKILLGLPKQPKTGKKGLLSAVFMNFCIAKRLSDRILFAVSAENIFKVPLVYSFMNGRFLPDKSAGCRLSAQVFFQSPPFLRFIRQEALTVGDGVGVLEPFLKKQFVFFWFSY